MEYKKNVRNEYKNPPSERDLESNEISKSGWRI